MGQDTIVKTSTPRLATSIDDLCVDIGNVVKSIFVDDLVAVFVRRYDDKMHLKYQFFAPHSALSKTVCSINEGIIGIASRRCELTIVPDPFSNPEFFLIEHDYAAKIKFMLCFPIVNNNSSIGMVVVLRQQSKQFSEPELNELRSELDSYKTQFVSMQSLYVQGYERKFVDEEQEVIDLKLHGIGVSPGISQGIAVRVPFMVGHNIDGLGGDSESEWQILEQSIGGVKQDLLGWKDFLLQQVKGSGAELFDAYIKILESQDFLSKMKILIFNDGFSASKSIKRVLGEYIDNIKETPDPIIRERSHDLQDLLDRVLIRIRGGDTRIVWPDKMVIYGDLITATQLLEVPQSNLTGVVCERGNTNSHVAILARELGIPCVMNCAALIAVNCRSNSLIVDGYTGDVLVAPSEGKQVEFDEYIEKHHKLLNAMKKMDDLPAQTKDGYGLHLYVNIGLANDIESILCSNIEGVGLFRTEIMFLARDYFPAEDEQERLYQKVLHSFAPKPVFIRTLDTGGDKPLPYFHPHEDNPFLGWRGIRVCLASPEVFKVHIRAILRANNNNNNLRIMLPMVTTLAEFRQAKDLIVECYHGLQGDFPELSLPPIGIMVEVPAVIIMIDEFMKLVDFVSVGSNDLTQYLLAVDRNNNLVKDLYHHLHPVVLRSLQKVVASAQRHQRHVSLCGEMASDPLAVVLLVAMGFDMLSLSAPSHARVKWVLQCFTLADCKKLLTIALQCEGSDEVVDLLKKEFIERDLALILKPCF